MFNPRHTIPRRWAMVNRNLQVFDQYRYGLRSVLAPGDRFRATGGPVYITDDSTVIPMRERGLFMFRKFCIQGAARWIEAYRVDGGTVILWVGKPSRSRTVPNLRHRPYRVAKVQDAEAQRGKQ
jgi:hypothetical protein